MATATREPKGPVHKTSAFLFRHPRTKLGAMLSPPIAWMLVVYLSSLALLFVTSFWRVNPLTSQIEQTWGSQNFQTLTQDSVYRVITLRTVGVAAAVTLADAIIAFPLAYYIARIASRRTRPLLLVAVVIPLWANYLVRVFAWKTILQSNGPADWVFAHVLGIHDSHVGASIGAVWITFTYLWLPFMILPIYAALERIPNSMLEASSDLGARSWRTFRSVVMPLAFPGIVAGSIFTFSLTLGDYITPILVGKGYFIGNAIYNFAGVANNLPLAAAFALVPVLIMAIYLFIARLLGAFEAL
jgi:putative spermidine/putrescine transport system permease protein